MRHRSGPVYYWYEGAMARFLHQHTDELATKAVGYEDVVVDSLDEVRWRLRLLCGLRSTLGSRILAVGGPGGWAQPAGVIPELARHRWQLDIQTLTYEELAKLIQAAKADQAAVDQCAGGPMRISPCPEPRWKRSGSTSTTPFCWSRSFVA